MIFQFLSAATFSVTGSLGHMGRLYWHSE